ncbi:MAG: hypothetical protein AB7W16_13325 [Candidatus Obscuribacterales bacterium]
MLVDGGTCSISTVFAELLALYWMMGVTDVARISLLLVLLSLLVGFRFSFWIAFPPVAVLYLVLVLNIFIITSLCRFEIQERTKSGGGRTFLIVSMELPLLLACSFFASTTGGTLWSYFFRPDLNSVLLQLYGETLKQPEVLVGSILGYAIGLLDLFLFFVFFPPDPGSRLKQIFGWVMRSRSTTTLVLVSLLLAGLLAGALFSVF